MSSHLWAWKSLRAISLFFLLTPAHYGVWYTCCSVVSFSFIPCIFVINCFYFCPCWSSSSPLLDHVVSTVSTVSIVSTLLPPPSLPQLIPTPLLKCSSKAVFVQKAEDSWLAAVAAKWDARVEFSSYHRSCQGLCRRELLLNQDLLNKESNYLFVYC